MDFQNEYSDLVEQTSSLLHSPNYEDFRKLLTQQGFELEQIGLHTLDGDAHSAFISIVCSDGHFYLLDLKKDFYSPNYSAILSQSKSEPRDAEELFLISILIDEEKRSRFHQDCLDAVNRKTN